VPLLDLLQLVELESDSSLLSSDDDGDEEDEDVEVEVDAVSLSSSLISSFDVDDTVHLFLLPSPPAETTVAGDDDNDGVDRVERTILSQQLIE